jgi:hypothetical protein
MLPETSKDSCLMKILFLGIIIPFFFFLQANQAMALALKM